MGASPTASLTLAGLRQAREEIAGVASRRGASNIRVFGSVARDEATASSDVDLLVELEPGRSLVDLGGLVMDLAELLGVDVDVITEGGLTPRMRARVLAEAVRL
ncbi:MAG: nucleotidyltransferase family protein [Actinomycetota bacterium]|nr:nucleotidyltransferase family protein [Actinomycetota bacterium]